MTTENTATETKTTKRNGQKPNSAAKPRVISNPGDVAGLVMMQVDAVNAKKDELTIAIKGLTDTTKLLVRAYADHAKVIGTLQQRIKTLEEQASK